MGIASANMKIADYKYDDNNLRTHKTIDLGSQLSYLFGAQAVANAEIDYIWNGDKLVGETIDCSGSIFNEFSGNDQINEAGKFNIVILYGNNETAYGLVVNKTEDAYGNEVNESNTYYYLKDADNTITGLLDSDGKCVVTYSYDAFGTATTDHAEGYKYLMLINPLAYKDYIYDYETGMYYLQSRYYAPFVGRFISADTLLDTGSSTAMCTNAYAYCENDPINNSDPTGHWAQNYRGFKWTSAGFNLYVNYAFVNKTFCKTYAADILRLKKCLFYKGMSLTRMAAELYFHAIVYYATNALTKIGVKNSTIKKWKHQAYYMQINYNDNRVGYFYALWGLSTAVIGRYL